jgi:hypothetical protein
VRSPTRQSRSRFGCLASSSAIVGTRAMLMAPFSTQPPQEPALQQVGVEPVGFRPAMFRRDRDTGGMDHVRLDPTRLEPARQLISDAGHLSVCVIGASVR